MQLLQCSKIQGLYVQVRSRAENPKSKTKALPDELMTSLIIPSAHVEIRGVFSMQCGPARVLSLSSPSSTGGRAPWDSVSSLTLAPSSSWCPLQLYWFLEVAQICQEPPFSTSFTHDLLSIWSALLHPYPTSSSQLISAITSSGRQTFYSISTRLKQLPCYAILQHAVFSFLTLIMTSHFWDDVTEGKHLAHFVHLSYFSPWHTVHTL